jgi:hypothetical protein
MDRAVGFDWDASNRDKCRKHGVSLAEIERLLSGTPRIAPDGKHSRIEERFVAVGRDSRGRAMFIVFTMRLKGGETFIRPISARYMHKEEIEGYEKEGSTVQE